jgi:hypothetical protein
MDEAKLLNSVKTALGITGTYQDETLKIYMYEVLEYLSDAGVSAETLMSPSIVGVVARGVSDLWNYGSSGGKLSEYFMQRAIQLRHVKFFEADEEGEA